MCQLTGFIICDWIQTLKRKQIIEAKILVVLTIIINCIVWFSKRDLWASRAISPQRRVIVVPHFKNRISNSYMHCTRISNCKQYDYTKTEMRCVTRYKDPSFTIINCVPGLMNPQNGLMLNVLQRGSWRWLQRVIHSILK